MNAAPPRRTTFKQSDVTRAIKGVTNAGVKVGRVEIDATGKIVILSGEGEQATAPNSWDRFLR